jgi:hypothetical protein
LTTTIRRRVAAGSIAVKAPPFDPLKIEPIEGGQHLCDQLASDGFLAPSPQTIQPPRTIVIDIARSDDEILAAMHQKTRYNIRLAAKKDVMCEKRRKAIRLPSTR